MADDDAYLQHHANLPPVDLSAIQQEIKQNMLSLQALFDSLSTSLSNPIPDNSTVELKQWSFGPNTGAQWHNNNGKPWPSSQACNTLRIQN